MSHPKWSLDWVVSHNWLVAHADGPCSPLLHPHGFRVEVWPYLSATGSHRVIVYYQPLYGDTLITNIPVTR